MNRRLLVILIILAVAVGAPIAWWLGSPLFIDQSVDEAFPLDIPDAEAVAAMPEVEKLEVMQRVEQEMPTEEEIAAMPDEQRNTLEQKLMEVAAVMPDKGMDEPMPDEPQVVVAGQFHDADSFHKGSGSATIYRLADGSHVLRFEEFSATNGPDLHVLLATAASPTSSSDLGDYTDLGQLKGNIGNQNYEIPTDVDVSQYHSVVIYCKPFHVVFAVASLAS